MATASGRPCRSRGDPRVSGFKRAPARRRRATDDLVLATFAPFEVKLLRQFAHEIVLLLQAEAGAGLDSARDDADDHADDEFTAITARSGLDAGSTGSPVVPSEDPVIARLFPDAYLDDDESAADFRRFTQSRLVEAKHASAQAVLDMLPDKVDEDDFTIALDRTAALQWLGTLNDIRLALGTRLGVEQDDDAFWEMLPDEDPRGTVHQIYQWLGWVEESLVSALPRPR
jgi:hypothetical protein